jgi:hypothetical protein
MSLLLRLIARRYMEQAGGDGGAGGGGGDGKKGAAPETFSREYVHELREENKSWRTKHQESETARKAAEDAAKAAEKTGGDKVKEVQTAADQRVIRAELKAAAIKAGMVDLDGLKLADLSKVKLNDQGEVEGADELMDAMKKAKPYLFGAPSTGNTQKPPKPGDQAPKLATTMTDAEYAAARAAAIRR